MKRTGSQLRDRVTYQESISVTNEYGERSEVWADIATFPARVIPQSGSERMRADQVDAVEQYLVECRTNGLITTHGRLIYKGQTLHIHAAPEVERGWMQLACSKDSL